MRVEDAMVAREPLLGGPVVVTSAQRSAAETASTAATAFDSAMRRHWAARLDADPAYSRDVLVALRAGSPSALEHAVARAAEALSAMGIASRRLRGDALVARLVLDDGASDAGFCRARLLQDP